MEPLHHFEDELRTLLIDFERPRPFVCEGNPLDCDIFIVGFNAATEMKANFWDFWSTEVGFNKQRWLDEYRKERAVKPLAPGKTRRNKISATRQRIEWMVSATSPHRCLETNLYAKATPDVKALEKKDRDSKIFQFLLKEVKPRVVLLHGVDARKHLALMVNQQIKEDHVHDVDLYGAKTKILAISHLSRGWSKQKTLAVGHLLRELCSM